MVSIHGGRGRNRAAPVAGIELLANWFGHHWGKGDRRRTKQEREIPLYIATEGHVGHAEPSAVMNTW
jgi:hypothetical protein